MATKRTSLKVSATNFYFLSSERYVLIQTLKVEDTRLLSIHFNYSLQRELDEKVAKSLGSEKFFFFHSM